MPITSASPGCLPRLSSTIASGMGTALSGDVIARFLASKMMLAMDFTYGFLSFTADTGTLDNLATRFLASSTSARGLGISPSMNFLKSRGMELAHRSTSTLRSLAFRLLCPHALSARPISWRSCKHVAIGSTMWRYLMPFASTPSNIWPVAMMTRMISPCLFWGLLNVSSRSCSVSAFCSSARWTTPLYGSPTYMNRFFGVVCLPMAL